MDRNATAEGLVCGDCGKTVSALTQHTLEETEDYAIVRWVCSACAASHDKAKADELAT